jgi:peptidoglycan hydrolase-like protein with peptidoglycan-binding domain
MEMLWEGSHGPDVEYLQSLLQSHGYACGAVDGIFGWQTKAAVEQLQTASGVTADGVVGPHTWAVLVEPAQTETATAIDAQATAGDATDQSYQQAGVASPNASDPAAVQKGDVILGLLGLHPSVVGETHVVEVDVHVLEQAGIRVPDRQLWVGLTADPYNIDTGQPENNAEQSIYESFYIPAIEARAQYHARTQIQLDAGHWHVRADLWGSQTTEPLDKTEGDVTTQGHHAQDVAFGKDTPFDLAVVVTHLTRVAATLYEVHFVISNLSSTHPVAAGLPVLGMLDSGDLGATNQAYDLPAPIAAGGTTQTYLTLSGRESGTLTATVSIDAGGASHAESAPLVIDAQQVHYPSPPPQGHGSTEASQADATVPPAPGHYQLPDLTDPDFAEKLKQWVHVEVTAGKVVTTATEIAGFFAKHGSQLALAGELAEPAGYVLALYTIFSEVIFAFRSLLEVQRNRGVVFGLMWETLGMADIQWTPTGLNSLGLPDDPFHSDEEQSEAFYEGVRKGRAKAREPDVKENISMALGTTMSTQKIDDIKIAATLVMSELFKQFGHTRTEVLEYP